MNEGQCRHEGPFLFGQIEGILLLSEMLTCTGLLQCLPVIPWHPGGGMRGQFGGVTLQYCEVVEGMGAVQFAGMNEAHVQVAHLRPVAGFIEERILAATVIFP